MSKQVEHVASVVRRRRAGHYEILGETSAKFEFFESGWNPYSRFLDVDKVDLILRRKASGQVIYRQVQVKFGKLLKGDSERWVLRRTTRRFTEVTDDVCVDVSQYRRNFALLDRGASVLAMTKNF